MYSPKNIIYFDPYYFDNGNSKSKYFLVIKSINDSYVVASLPTTKDHIPDHMDHVSTGCINNDIININCFFFKSGDIISECGTFGFPRNTYAYGETVKILDKSILESIYQKEGIDYKILGKLKTDVYDSIVECLKNSSSVKRKIKNLL
jgi:hypothetical protein